jgi:hypothetical protein
MWNGTDPETERGKGWKDEKVETVVNVIAYTITEIDIDKI